MFKPQIVALIGHEWLIERILFSFICDLQTLNEVLALVMHESAQALMLVHVSVERRRLFVQTWFSVLSGK